MRELTDLQLDGMACVACGTIPETSVPVLTLHGSQVFACVGCVANITPNDDLVEHDESSACVCGPETRLADMVLIFHHSLDNREADEI